MIDDCWGGCLFFNELEARMSRFYTLAKDYDVDDDGNSTWESC